jgi:hypothetical protein
MTSPESANGCNTQVKPYTKMRKMNNDLISITSRRLQMEMVVNIRTLRAQARATMTTSQEKRGSQVRFRTRVLRYTEPKQWLSYPRRSPR